MDRRILIIANGHPEISKGGAEKAAYNLFLELSRRKDCDVVFLAWAKAPGHGGTPFAARKSNNEMILHTGMSDFFLYRSQDPQVLCHDVRQFLQTFKPTVVHFHHYVHIGLELVRLVHNSLPDARIVMTLHEYLAICNNSGQMVKTNGGALCYRSSPSDCHQCFPDRTPGDFFMRELFIKSFFELVDVLISPSQFLIDRYVDWGISKKKFTLIENGQPAAEQFNDRSLAEGEGRVRFGYFGQVNPFKGLDVLLEAVASLSDPVKEVIQLDIHGSRMDDQPSEFQERINTLLGEINNLATFHGPYESEELPKLMRSIDWVVIPSIWWENSPLVIQEAFNYGRPVICGDIGGMAEKVVDGQNGLHFRCRKPHDLAKVLEKAVTQPGLWDALVEGITPPLSMSSCAKKHWELYHAEA